MPGHYPKQNLENACLKCNVQYLQNHTKSVLTSASPTCNHHRRKNRCSKFHRILMVGPRLQQKVLVKHLNGDIAWCLNPQTPTAPQKKFKDCMVCNQMDAWTLRTWTKQIIVYPHTLVFGPRRSKLEAGWAKQFHNDPFKTPSRNACNLHTTRKANNIWGDASSQ